MARINLLGSSSLCGKAFFNKCQTSHEVFKYSRNNEDSILSTSQLNLINKEALLFDVNYINSPSKLLRDASSLSLNCIDGSRMNLMQAVIGFCLANDLVGKEDVVHQHMLEAIKEI